MRRAAMGEANRGPSDDAVLAPPVGETDHALGPASAPVTLVEYGDYECPDCLNAFPIVRDVLGRAGDRVRFVFRHFPLNSIHPHASAAARAAEAAGVQGKFWEMHETLFRNQHRLGEVDYLHLALRLGLEVYRFRSDLGRDSIARRVRAQYEGGVASGVRGTPTFFINGRRHAGPKDLDGLLAAVTAAAGSAAVAKLPADVGDRE